MPIAPLKKRKPSGELYFHPAEIEAVLVDLLALSTPELLERARVDDKTDPAYVPSECILYFVRRPSSLNDEAAFRELFVLLRKRVQKAVPVPRMLLPGTTKTGQNSVALDIQHAVLQKFHTLLCQDRNGYEERLDFFEIRFNKAVARLRQTARRDVLAKAAPLEPLESECNPGEPSAEVESALERLRPTQGAVESDFLFRSKLHAAISVLPDDQRRVVELLLQEIPIDSQDEEVLTIAKILKCDERTVRNRRDRAFKKLHDALKEEDDE